MSGKIVRKSGYATMRQWRQGERHTLRLDQKGFTLAEMLVTMVVMLMASAVLAQSLSFAIRSFQFRTGEIEAKLLCETVSLLVQNDLTNRKLEQEDNPLYECTNQDAEGFGIVANIGDITLPSSCYGYGRNSLPERTVRITIETMDSQAMYKVSVEVKNIRGFPVASNTFTVSPLQ